MSLTAFVSRPLVLNLLVSVATLKKETFEIFSPYSHPPTMKFSHQRHCASVHVLYIYLFLIERKGEGFASPPRNQFLPHSRLHGLD